MCSVLKNIKTFFINEKYLADKNHIILLDVKSSLFNDWKAVGNDLNNVLKEWKKSYVKK